MDEAELFADVETGDIEEDSLFECPARKVFVNFIGHPTLFFCRYAWKPMILKSVSLFCCAVRFSLLGHEISLTLHSLGINFHVVCSLCRPRLNITFEGQPKDCVM